jgi:hypothetical protein
MRSVAETLAHEHTGDHPLDDVYWLPHESEVFLVIVSPLIADKREILPFRFAPDPPDIPCDYVVVLLSDKDWRTRHKMIWPEGVDVDKLVMISGGVP